MVEPARPYKPPKPPLRLKTWPRFSEVYWCDFSISNILPEFDDEHPVIIIRTGGKLDRPHLVVPLTTIDQGESRFSHELLRNPIPQRTPRRSWAICNHIYTVASERLRPITDPSRYGDPVYPKIDKTDMKAIGHKIFDALDTLVRTTILPKST